MWKDPIVEELHALRAQMTQAVGGDMHRYAQQLRDSQQQRLAARNQLAQPSNRTPTAQTKRSLS